MIDRYGRNINKLRVSLSEACDLACLYCVDQIGAHRVSPHQLSAEQLLKLIQLLYHYAGIEKIRITGGEPLLYRSLLTVIEGIRQLGMTNIGLTSNGQHLAKKADALEQAGVQHINISLDSLKPDNFRTLARVGHLHKTLEGIDAALQAGLRVKLNMVVMKGKNDHEIVDILKYGLSRNIEVRYLEVMKMGPLYQNNTLPFMSMSEILEKIRSFYTVFSDTAESDSTALRFKVLGGSFGIIANESAPFCGNCSRLRLTSDGNLVGCLSNPTATSIRHLLEHPHPEKELRALVEQTVAYKRIHRFTGSELVMSQIGG